MKVGYCCNVHGGRTLEEVKANLEQYSTRVKEAVSPNESMPIGLWLSQSAIDGLGLANQKTEHETQRFANWLAERGLEPFTLNGFPLGDFHQDVVKRDVYLPTWESEERLSYTLKLAEIQELLLAASTNQSGFQTISTLPLGWPPVSKEELFEDGQQFLKSCALNLKELAKQLAKRRDDCGVRTIVCIEPEPGCVFDRCEEICQFFDEHLFDGAEVPEEIVREHIGVCHDICHSAVMFEDQAVAVAKYKDAGITIGKVQVSSAIKCLFDSDAESNSQRIQQLSGFSEKKYLHQTKIQRPHGEFSFFEDLPEAISSNEKSKKTDEEWRVHFHVPIFAERLGLIQSTQCEISAFLTAIKEHGVAVEHFEVETYAWNVLPPEFNDYADDLAAGITEEIHWFNSLHKKTEA